MPTEVLDTAEVTCDKTVIFVYSLFLNSNIFHLFELYELYFILVKVHKVQAKNKVHKVRTSQLCIEQNITKPTPKRKPTGPIA